ncbi:hypothetical protein CcaverHIS002_0505070 [Cutaneotrichosporon cavernicola]|uniref:Metallo-beta-lactamase domain-containing protein n=1 Tax=Cutaneotrichosporon cavernicola TaxID=279322 RepID=A0AA48L6P1_9TREE|nr:uncharacterized protein CcaverHIS019_0505600 [Cutaneotrichosporon cavernicola]BEI85106.1 hypothetical protein CcaverHIS002_0505070 [Cutaneotrichosporon cavernicola]BEI92932.1 hypothetical protein CcaverHIS019_0505600 [Cutaneotrichosporon cavernicola]BEJ00708.1 hypothetical protein CcaverHIS631_0505650 [Cutaneotrichosporon cavernicola]BEJ08475.1 hypothetical protein CcaverHIS641_0505690 [Cutaneotrichosporon cavernicola]
MLRMLRRAAIVIPLAWSGVWLGYYAYTDTLRRSHIRSRNKELGATLQNLQLGTDGPASEEEKAAIKKRFSSLQFAGRYWNPYVEWREQGAWEWAWWKVILSTINGKIFSFDGDLPEERPIPDLPVETPNFALLYGKEASVHMPVSTDDKGTENGHPQVNGYANGHVQANVHANGHANGHTNGHANGEAVPPAQAMRHRTHRGGADIDITDKFTITWMGQSTSYVTLDKLAILTDPALQDRTIPSTLAPQRIRPAPCTYEDLKRVDLVLVSHNHYDHLDPQAVVELGDSCEWVVPIGAGDFLRDLGVTRVTELDWWQESKHTLQRPGEQDRTYTITAVPVMHWSARSPADTNATLWSAFHVKSDTDKPRSFIHLGDTGYSPTLYEAVGRVLGPVDLAAIPIGSYEPRWHMHLQHTDPEGAVRIALNLGAKKSIGVHWGTWIMSDEAYNMPPIDLAKARNKLGVSEDTFSTVPVGQTVVVE